MNEPLIVSRPTFAELADAAGKSGLTDALCEDGIMRFPELAIGASRDQGTAPGRAARIASQIEEAASTAVPCAEVYENDGFRIVARCRDDGVHLLSEDQPTGRRTLLIVPFDAVTATVGALLDCAASHGR